MQVIRNRPRFADVADDLPGRDRAADVRPVGELVEMQVGGEAGLAVADHQTVAPADGDTVPSSFYRDGAVHHGVDGRALRGVHIHAGMKGIASDMTATERVADF
jgi:hypothetical protein